MEEWRDIKGYEGIYQVSNEGRIKSLERYLWNGKAYFKSKTKILNPRKDKDGYLFVTLCRNAEDHKNCKVHRLVAEAFIPNPYDYKEINHKNEDKTLNTVENLEWCDRSHNMNWNCLSERIGKILRNNKSLSKRVLQLSIDGELITIYDSSREAERKGFNHCGILRCANGTQETYKGYIWKYE